MADTRSTTPVAEPESRHPRPVVHWLRRILRTVAMTASVVASLLVFPSGLLWMVACWLAAFSVLVACRLAGWLPLAACVAVLVVKRPDWSPWMIALAATMTVVAIWRLALSTRFGLDRGRRLGWVAVTVLWSAWGVTVWQSQRATHRQPATPWDASRAVVCLGDSLTTGLSDEEAYPRYLQQSLDAPVVNLGRAGYTTRDAIAQLPAMAEAQPQLVVVELGGNDYLRGYERAEVRKNLVQVIEASRAAGAEVMLVEIPRGFVIDPFSGLERELARKYDLELVPDTAIRMLVLRSGSFPWSDALAGPWLSDDGLHPNVAGARHLADAVRREIEQMYGGAAGRDH